MEGERLWVDILRKAFSGGGVWLTKDSYVLLIAWRGVRGQVRQRNRSAPWKAGCLDCGAIPEAGRGRGGGPAGWCGMDAEATQRSRGDAAGGAAKGLREQERLAIQSETVCIVFCKSPPWPPHVRVRSLSTTALSSTNIL